MRMDMRSGIRALRERSCRLLRWWGLVVMLGALLRALTLLSCGEGEGLGSTSFCLLRTL